MSSGGMAVRFPDGTILYGRYSGTVDMAHPSLHPSWDEVPPKNRHPWPDEPTGSPEPVEIATNYGGGFYWPGLAYRTETGGVLDSGSLYPWGVEFSMSGPTQHEPEWRKDGEPEWWPR